MWAEWDVGLTGDAANRRISAEIATHHLAGTPAEQLKSLYTRRRISAIYTPCRIYLFLATGLDFRTRVVVVVAYEPLRS